MKLRCRFGIHDWEWCGSFVFCRRPGCSRVYWWTGDKYWDLDVCDTREELVLVLVQ